jgi:hypothetical protein
MVSQVEGAINSARIADYRKPNSDNRVLRAKMQALIAVCDQFLDKTKAAAVKAA